MRAAICGSLPVDGLPRLFLCATFIDFFINLGVTEKQAEGKGSVFRPGSNPSHEGRKSMTQADSVHSTPPTNTSRSRRTVLAGIASAAALPIAAAAPVAAARTLDAELVELGARFEPLVDQYYVARKHWARSLVSAHAEHDLEFGDPADRNYQPRSEIVAAFMDSCERLGVREADDALSAIQQEMKQLVNAINAASVTSIEGLRAKALVAFWEVAPFCAEDTEFSFDDAYPFQQLFAAVAELCGLKDKMAATGYELPGIAMDDDDSDDDGEEA
jgi:hypothetical protein